ncbi:MAG: RdgB/HAM1 family non-canonical purine NTP pyrophosphatase [Pyrinomonadaceae bacterium]
MKRLLVATRNKGKIAELASLLADLPAAIVGLDELGIRDLVSETGDTFSANADLKAAGYARLARTLSLADDSGLVVDALDGAPGVLSARYAGPHATDRERIDKLIREMIGVPPELRTARFVCAVSIADEHGRIIHRCEGVCEGTIAAEPRGSRGFGYDPIFVPAGYDETFGELSSAVKDEISHRAQATRLAVRFLQGFLAALT